MPYKPNDLQETVTVLGVAFIVGAISQYIKQRVDAEKNNDHILWLSLASGLSAMVIIGLVYEYTQVSPGLLMAISGVAGWAGIAILTTLSKALNKGISKEAERRLNIKMDEEEKDA